MELCNTGSSQHEEMVSLEIWSPEGPGVGISLFFHGTNLDLLRILFLAKLLQRISKSTGRSHWQTTGEIFKRTRY